MDVLFLVGRTFVILWERHHVRPLIASPAVYASTILRWLGSQTYGSCLACITLHSSSMASRRNRRSSNTPGPCVAHGFNLTFPFFRRTCSICTMSNLRDGRRSRPTAIRLELSMRNKGTEACFMTGDELEFHFVVVTIELIITSYCSQASAQSSYSSRQYHTAQWLLLIDKTNRASLPRPAILQVRLSLSLFSSSSAANILSAGRSPLFCLFFMYLSTGK